MSHPLCFVLMPCGRKASVAGAEIDFDAIYANVIAPALAEVGLEPIRATHEAVDDILHKPMHERFILCEYAVADLTTANANVFYEVGLRHATRPHSTVLLFAKHRIQLHFAAGLLQAFPYELSQDGTPANVEATKAILVQSLRAAQQSVAEGVSADNPVFQLVETPPPAIAHAKTDIFRDQVQYSAEKKAALAEARQRGIEAVRACEQQFGALADVESGVVIDLLLSYRAVKAWNEMIALGMGKN